MKIRIPLPLALALAALILAAMYSGQTTLAEEPERPTIQPPTHLYFPIIRGSGPTWTPTSTATPTATATSTRTATPLPTRTPTPLPDPLVLEGYQDTWIWNQSPNQPWAALSGQIMVGHVPQNQQADEIFIGLAQFDLRDLMRASQSLQLVSAILVMNVNGACDNCTSSSFSVSEIDSSWVESEATWNSMSAHLGPERTRGGQYNATTNQIRIDITELVRNWWRDSSGHPNYGLSIASVGPVVHFKSHRFTSGGGPTIEVRFR